MCEKTLGGLKKLFIVCFAVMAASILLRNGACLAAVCLLAAWWICGRRLPRFTVLLFFGTLLVRLAGVAVAAPPIVSDFYAMYHAALSLNAGDLSYLQSTYFSLWAYQNGFVVFEAMLLRIWNNPLCLQIANCLFSAGTVCFLYRLALTWVGPRAARMAGVLAACCPLGALLPSVLTNQISGAFFMVLAVWLLVSRDCARLGFWRFPLAGLSLQLGNILRPEGVILLVGLAAWTLFSLLERRESAKRLLCGMLALLAVYAAVAGAVDQGLRISGLSPNGLENGNPLWKFVTGLNPSTQGGYSAEDWAQIQETMEDGRVSEETVSLEKELIRERLGASPVQWIKLLSGKIKIQWCDDGLYWIFGPFEGWSTTARRQATADLCKAFDRAWFFMALGLAVYGLLNGRRRADELLPYFVMFAAFCAFLAIEVQQRYAYMPQLFLFLSAAFGLERIGRGKQYG